MNDKGVNVIQESQTALDLSERFERLKTSVDRLNSRYAVIHCEGIRTDLASAIQAAVMAYDKIQDNEVKRVAKGLALAAIGKLHIEIDKI